MSIQNSRGAGGARALVPIVNDPVSPRARAPGDSLWIQAYDRDPALGDEFDVALIGPALSIAAVLIFL